MSYAPYDFSGRASQSCCSDPRGSTTIRSNGASAARVALKLRKKSPEKPSEGARSNERVHLEAILQIMAIWTPLQSPKGTYAHHLALHSA